MIKSLTISVLSLVSTQAFAFTLHCSQVEVGVQPHYSIEQYNGASAKVVRSSQNPSEPFVAIVEETASDLITYVFPSVIQEESGAIGMQLKTLGIQSDACADGQDAALLVKDLAGEVSSVPYCCK